MPKVNILNIKGENVGELELNETIFATKVSENAVYEVIKNQLANKRQGTQSAKTRAEVRGGGRKPFRQKGTGRARQGSIRAPHYTGGGVVFAPKPRDYSMKMNKREKQIAIKSALTSKVQDSKLIVVDEFKLDEIKTSKFAQILDNLKAPKALVVTKDKDEKVVLSARNIPTVKTTMTNSINVYDILKYDSLVITKDAVAAIEEVYA